jgi:chemotaxis protein methyltransferase CheR
MSARVVARAEAGESIVPGEFPLRRDDFRRIAEMIHADAGISLNESKAALVYARLAKRLRALKMQAFCDYCDLVDSPEGEAERNEMLTSLTTNVTRFLREPHHFEHLTSHILRPFLDRGARGRLRLWSAACSTGQEPYSMAFALLTVWPDAVNHDARILATDVDRKVLATAEEGTYGEAQMEGLTSELRRRFIEPAGAGQFRVVAAVRKLISFRQLNLVESWPMQGQFQAIFCRNVVIYFDEPTQQTLWQKFVPLMTADGALYIGHSERVTGPAVALLRSEGVSSYRRAGTAR